MSNDIEIKTKDFIEKCTEECRQAFPEVSLEALFRYTTIQLVGKVFELEAKVKEIENEL